MPPHARPISAASALLTLAVLSGGCEGANLDERILFGCESHGSCSKPDHVCGLDGLCHPRGERLRTQRFSPWDLQGQEGSSGGGASGGGASGGGASGQAPHSSQAQTPAPTEDARADARCAKRCAVRQAGCTASCEEGTKCRQHCSRSADTCYAQCRRTVDTREAARQRRDDKNCMGGDGRPRRCSAAEELQLRAAMRQAAERVCVDANGEQVLCPEQLQRVEAARRFLPKDCHATGCEGDAQE